MRLLDNLRPLGLLALRVVLGIIMVAHGYPKVMGGLGKHYQFVDSIGLPGWWAYPSAGAEFFGGLLVIAGLFTRFSSFAIFINMMVAVFWVHWKNGLTGKGGYEFPLALAAIAFSIIFFGGGPLSVDALIFGRKGGGKASPQKD